LQAYKNRNIYAKHVKWIFILMYMNYTLWSKKEKETKGHSILLASKSTTNYPLLPYKRIAENKNYKGFYKNELQIQFA
jgi:hypothetical protein